MVDQPLHEVCARACVPVQPLLSRQLFIPRKRLKGGDGGWGGRGAAFDYIIWRCGGMPPPPTLLSAVLPWTQQNKQGKGRARTLLFSFLSHGKTVHLL